MVLLVASRAGFAQIPLGSLSHFSLFTAVGAVANTGPNTGIAGNIGTNVGAVSGYSSSAVGEIHTADKTTAQGAIDVQTAYNSLLAQAPTAPAFGAALGGMTLTPGVYGFGGAASLAGILTLDARNDANAVFIFKVGGALSVGAASQVILINGASANNVFWQVNGAATIGAQSTFAGVLIANGAIGLADGVNLNGRAFATTGAISTYNNQVSVMADSPDPVAVLPTAPALGSLANFNLFTAIGAVTNTGLNTAVTGNIGTNVGAVSGYSSSAVGEIHTADKTTAQGAIDVQTAYNSLLAQAPTAPAVGAALGGMTLTPGVYGFGGAASLAGILTLDARNDANAVFIFKVGGALSVGAASQVILINGASANNVFWQVNGAATIGAQSTFAGVLIADGAIGLADGVNLNGRAFATTGAISTYNSRVSVTPVPVPVPTPVPVPVPAPTPNNALAFNGTNNSVPIARSIQDDFTIEYWVKTTQISRTGSQWFLGNGIVDAEVAGVTNDFGTALLNGKASFGTGDPDVTIMSNTTINDGKWHHIAATRTKSTGLMLLYVDGRLEASSAGITTSTIALIAPPRLLLGGTQTGVSYFAGQLDEVRLYTTALSADQINADRFSTKSALPGSQVAYYDFDQGVAGGNNPGLTTLTDQSGNSNLGTLTNFALTGTSSNWVRSFPTISAISPAKGVAGTLVSVTGTNLLDATSLSFNNIAVPKFSPPATDFSLTVVAPVGVSTGPIGVSSNALALYSGPVFTGPGSAPTYNYALSFIGNLKQYVEGTNANLPMGDSPRTLEAWVYYDGNTGNNAIFNYGASIPNQRSGILCDNGRLYYVGEGNDQSGNITLTQNAWNHIAATYDGTTLRLYVNGILDLQSKPIAFNTTGTTWRIGQRSDPLANEFLTGNVDEVRVWNVARTAEQIANYQHISLSGSNNSLVANYHFNEGHGNTVADDSRSGSTGTLYNSPTWITNGAPVSSVPINFRAAPTTTPALAIDEFMLFPNPANARFTVLVPAVAGTAQLQGELLNTLGQVVRRISAALPADGARLTVETTGLALGVYTLRLHAGPTTLSKRVVLQ